MRIILFYKFNIYRSSATNYKIMNFIDQMATPLRNKTMLTHGLNG